VYPTTQTSDIWSRGSPWEAFILKGVKIFITLFSKVVSLILMKFGMMGALGIAGLKWFDEFWPTFSGNTNFRSRISPTFFAISPQNRARLGVWQMDISSPNLVNFDSGVQRCHAVTCISPSLIHLSVFYFVVKKCVVD